MEIDDTELASKLYTSISRLGKMVKREVKHDKLLSITERSTLSLLYKQSGMLPSELAAIEIVTGQSMSQIINKLCKNGLTRRKPSKEDKRKVLVEITSKGREFIELKRSRANEWLAKIISEKISESEKETLISVVNILTKITD
ncbi:MarR family transcriptional regulator [uncultured Bacteroides sp.]|uniref:MarR family winged helix-turn-helix transcriptional regulator n=1 Tax=uncultured Bacteroides sp. TaxID=162156 RepID=UPI002AA798A3|nr:MarR family transcriptional regulator [uncultured Bacteroides sp.]